MRSFLILSSLVLAVLLGCKSYDLPENKRGVATTGQDHEYYLGYYWGFDASGYYQGKLGAETPYRRLCNPGLSGAYYSGFCQGYKDWKKNPNPWDGDKYNFGYYLGYKDSGYYGDKTNLSPFVRLCSESHSSPWQGYYEGYCAGYDYRVKKIIHEKGEYHVPAETPTAN